MNRLLEIGFTNIGFWKLMDGKPVFELADLADAKNVIYAFVSNADVKYIGVTKKTLKKRMYGYQNPGPTQSTNKKNNRCITGLLLEDQTVDILALADNGLLRYGNFPINFAAGLEDGLIAELNPEWNGTKIKKDLIAPRPRYVSVPNCEASDVLERDSTSPAKTYRGKYITLKEYLADKLGVDSITLSYPEIENIIGTKLPKSAYTFREWWANGGHSQAYAWMQAGWRVESVILGESITFRLFHT